MDTHFQADLGEIFVQYRNNHATIGSMETCYWNSDIIWLLDQGLDRLSTVGSS